MCLCKKIRIKVTKRTSPPHDQMKTKFKTNAYKMCANVKMKVTYNMK